MLDEIQHWESMTPIALASKLKQKAFMKKSQEDIDQMTIEYFSHLHSKKTTSLSNIQIGDEFSLLCYFAEIFSIDPTCQLLHWGIVIFNDSVCINLDSLSHFISMPVPSILESMKKSNYFFLQTLPANFFQTLMQLGFITSLDFLMFTISPADPFFFHIGCQPSIVQPFPLELIDLLLFSKQEIMNLEKKRLNKYIESARKRVESQQMNESDENNKGIEKSNSQNILYDEEED